MVSISNNGTFAGVDVMVIVSAAGDTDTVLDCAVASAAQASERTNDLDIGTKDTRYQKDGDDIYI